MTQLFHRRFGFLFRIGMVVVVAAVVTLIFMWRAVMSYPANVGEALEQPVPFSHKHHVGDDGIDCRYCHTSVEQSKFAGIPPLATCMTCHSQLYTDQPVLAPLVAAFRSGVPFHWKRLYKLPDFVYFNHSIHIAKGVGCEGCHGQIDTMPLTTRVTSLTMQWCLDCHRNPEPHLRPREEVFNLHWHPDNQLALGRQLVRAYHIDKRRLTDCSLCHR
ncbi:MAG: cytochrome c3 family protein [Rhodanobacteraceae bacterium]